MFSGGTGTGIGPSGNVFGRWIKAGSIEFRDLGEGEAACDEADEC